MQTLGGVPAAAATPRLFVGTAGWSIPRASAQRLVGEGSHLQRYARVLNCAEINSSFYRSHRTATYEKWAASTPDDFRFAIKMPRAITHERFKRARLPLERFLDETAGLGHKRGPLLIQLPPSLAFNAQSAARFFGLLRERYSGLAVCEPRHSTWLSPAADALLVRSRIARVAADPPRASGADRPGGWDGVVYFRQHGSPRPYWSRYTPEQMEALTEAVSGASTVETWCVFDNTASGAAFGNALDLVARMSS